MCLEPLKHLFVLAVDKEGLNVNLRFQPELYQILRRDIPRSYLQGTSVPVFTQEITIFDTMR